MILDVCSVHHMEILPLGFFKVRFVFSCAGIIDEMGFSLAFSPFGDGNIADEVAADAADDFGSSTLWLASDSGNAWTWQRVEATQMLQDGPFTSVASVGEAGTSTSETLPPNCCQLVRKVTEAGGRQNRGRFYMPPYRMFDGAVSNAGVIATASLVALNSDLDSFFAKLALHDLDPVLLHSDVDTDPTPILGFQAVSVIATQRRRLR